MTVHHNRPTATERTAKANKQAAQTKKDREAVRAIMEKCGFRYDGTRIDKENSQ